MIDRDGFRLNIGIILSNDQGQLFWGKRVGSADAWQFPQGGMLPYETIYETMYRELTEEIGLNKNDVEIIGVTKRWLRYRLPHHMRRYFQSPLCIGQKQKWFLLKLTSKEENICLTCTAKPEFVSWKWVDYWQPLDQVIYFKREIYQKVLKEFEPMLKK
ncbi:MAG: RNA pyrophosphohydrolase [Gammaproteobacteria bacterium]|nr:RNA pyrophosphohydrolase [Gammaproteobacteria bacterium]